MSDTPHLSPDEFAAPDAFAQPGDVAPDATPELQALAQAWRAALLDELPAARELRMSLHASPCISGQEEPTALQFETALSEVGVRLDRVAETGRIGRLGPASGPSVALRSELDALPVQENTGVPFASSNGAMHACGHDVHLAALAAVTRAAARLESSTTPLPFGLVVVAQPREERYPSGAEDIVASGRLSSEQVRYAVAAHVHPGVPAGAVALGEGFVNAAADEFEIVLEGQGGHGAYPHQARDVVAPLASIALALPELVRRTVAPLDGALLSVGTIQAGDGAPNVLPGTGRIFGTMRTTTREDRVALGHAVSELASGIAASWGVRASTAITRGEPALINDPLLTRTTSAWLADFGYPEAEPMRSLGADDFSFFTEAGPVLMAFVGVGKGRDPEPSLHDPEFLPGDEAVDAVAHTLLAGYIAGAALLDAAP